MSDLREHGQKTNWCERYWSECIKTEHIEKRYRKRNYAPQARHQKKRMARNRRRAHKNVELDQ